jgi:DNA polymerase III delta prime subunit
MANYVANVLSERGLVKKVYLVNPPMSRGSKYLQLHKAIMNAFRNNSIIPSIFEKALDEVNNRKELGDFKNLLNACNSYKNGKVSETELIRFVSGDKLTSSMLEKLEVTGSLDTFDALKLLRIIADLFWNIEGKMLMIVLDEVDNLKEATLGARDFKEAFRQVAEMSKLSIIFIFNVATKDKLSIDVLPSPLKDTGVVTRIGSRNYMIAPEAMRITELRGFVEEVNCRLRGKNFKVALKRANKKYGKEEIDENLFPFTNSGFKAFETKVQNFLSESEKGRALLPRSVLNYINECCAEATLLSKSAIDEKVIEEVGSFSQ